MKKKIIFMAEKQKEYSRSAEKLSSSLKMSGFKKELTHDAIVELKNTLVTATFIEKIWVCVWLYTLSKNDYLS